MTWSRKQAESSGFPRKFRNPFLFALTMNFFRLKINIFIMGRLGEESTKVFFSHLGSLICMGTYS